MIQLSALSKSFGDRILLDSVSWQIDDGERVGLSGPNGAGKTTLLKMLAGLDEPDKGTVVKPAGLTIGYLPQDGLSHSGRTLVDEAGLAFKPLLDMKAEIAAIEERLGHESASEAEHAADAHSLQRAAGGIPASGRLQHRSEDHDGAARPRLRCRRSGEPDRNVLGRLADAHRAREASARTTRAAAPRRADQPSRSRRAELARGISLHLPLSGHPRLPRSLLPRRGRHAHHRDRPTQADRLRRQLQLLSPRARGADGTAPPAEARPGRRDRADGSVHQSLPLPSDESRSGPEPDQDARQDRADRDPAGTQARALRVSRLREERPHGARSARDFEGVRIAARVRRGQPAHRARRSHCADRPERRRKVDDDAHAVGCRSARSRARGPKATRS